MSQDDILAWFEMPAAMVRPALAACRSFNTALDVAFYDVPTLIQDLQSRGDRIIANPDSEVADVEGRLNLGALSNPEGLLIVVSADRAPFIKAFHDVSVFLDWHAHNDEPVKTASLTGVGSSALGGVALAWNISKALNSTVLAIVPGYGVADAVLQGLGGWIGFGLHDALDTKSHIQDVMAVVARELAWLGRKLVGSIPDSKRSMNGAPVFQTGSGSSDVLHALMKRITFKRVVGHSKGALSIANAVRSLESEHTDGLNFVILVARLPKNRVAPAISNFWVCLMLWARQMHGATRLIPGCRQITAPTFHCPSA
jgi:hypothetical protein